LEVGLNLLRRILDKRNPNLKALKTKVYDVVIVGAGISGALVAAQLKRKGKSVLILEAGLDEGLKPSSYQDYLEHFYTQEVKVPNSPYPNNPNAPQSNVLDIQKIEPGTPDVSGYYVQYGPLPFSSTNTRAVGGTTLHWLGICLRMLPNDFRMRSKYGYGVDWPLKYKDLKSYYEQAELEIGVSADVEDLRYPGTNSSFFGKGYRFPMHKIPPSYLDQVLTRRLKGMIYYDQQDEVKIDVVSIPQGRNSIPNKHYIDPRTNKPYQPVSAVGHPHMGERCEGNSSCIPICPVQAKYNALKTLDKAVNGKGKGRVEVRTQCVVSRLEIDSDNGKIKGVIYQHYPGSNKERTAVGKCYVLAASAIENAKLMLASGAAKTSGQLGCNLMDHPYLLTWALMPDPVGPFRGPFSTSGIPSFRDGPFRKRHSAFRTDIGNWGWNFPTGAPFSDVQLMVDQHNLFGKELRNQLYNSVQKQFRFGFLIEQIPQTSNRVTIDPNHVDAMGNYRPVIYYNLSEYELAGFATAKSFSDQVFQRLGAAQFTSYAPSDPGFVQYEGMGYSFHGSGHIVGTHRMGNHAHDSVVSKTQKCWDHQNLYLVGCGSMPTIGTSNPTLTMAALALQASESITNDLR